MSPVNEEVSIKVGDTIPEGTFKYVPYTNELADNTACGVPQEYKTSEWKGKKIVVVSVPGAFTPTCHQEHLPGFIKNFDTFRQKGVDAVVFLAANDPFVMSAWGRVEGLADKIIYASDPNARWSSELGLAKDLTGAGFGIRTQRYALIVDDLKVTFIATESGLGLENSSAEKILAHL
ncbi:thioredoxin-dependent peroxidase [Macrolepiota fuliginosa MF-IS2]|uniref:Putative peroxiredoxin n=1 Tax=Macrolepiota fuliginosa MF-IS2 TaxID=1400762 RepID=A0A9P5X4M6_9AGAR|nr:thioredoxin-dependent peroxidase [Macrolepiota fuliginosa MF-IS2]